MTAHQEVRERRYQLRHPRYAAPELLAGRRNELRSWDITQLLGPAKRIYFYVMLDVFNHYVVGRVSTAARSPSTPIAGRR